MNIKKTVKALLIINGLQFIAAILLWLVIGTHVLGRVNPAVYLTIGILLLSSLLTLLGLYAASRYQDDSYRESMKNLENLNLKLRAQRHDYLNHLQVIYGLLQLGEYEDAREYMEPVFRDISRVTKAMKTSQPAVNALLQAKMESAEKNGIDMVVEVGTPLKEIPLEPWELCKILANLIDNAITALGEREKDRKLTVEIRQEKEMYIFRIRNNGPAIPADRQPLIFHQGFSTKREEGHGTGLTIVSEIVKDIRGTISLTSDEKETCFEVRRRRVVRDGRINAIGLIFMTLQL